MSDQPSGSTSVKTIDTSPIKDNRYNPDVAKKYRERMNGFIKSVKRGDFKDCGTD